MNGWLLDIHPGAPGEMVVWLKLEDGRVERLVDSWSPSLFVASESMADIRSALKPLREEVAWAEPVRKRERITDREERVVMEVKVKDARALQRVAGRVEGMGPFGAFRLYNADVPPNQSYLYEKDLFPLASCAVERSGGRLYWTLTDDVMRTDYETPGLRTLRLETEVRRRGLVPHLTDPLSEVRLSGAAERTITCGDEAEAIIALVDAVEEIDPDFLVTRDGDTFLLPHLIARAEANGVGGRLALDREGTVLSAPRKKGTSYFSYGKIHFKPSSVKLYGRIHVDASASFSYSEAGFEGLFELARDCRMPLQAASRASIGKALSSLQFYNAWRRNLLVPWKPTMTEHFKDRAELLLADRGGFIFEPKVGLHEGIGELDFSSLYPNIMWKKNISAETVKCPCCPDSENRVPELGWNVCRKEGLVPASVSLIVKKRLDYKALKSQCGDGRGSVYDERQAALKWLGVTTFGYLGFNNAKFGRIDAHIAVCAWDRTILLGAARTAERRGFQVVHGIVDSLWVKRRGADEGDYLELKAEIERETGFEMTFEGVYKWVAFLRSKVDRSLPVLNAYFGAYRDGRTKLRGIEARRRDTPLALKRCQVEVVDLLASAGSAWDARRLLPGCAAVFMKYARAIARREFPAEEMAFTRSLSKAPAEYSNRTPQASVAAQLAGEGVELHAGEEVRVVVTDQRAGRAVPLDFGASAERYDTGRYIELLARACATVLTPFDCSMDAAWLLREYAREAGYGRRGLA